MVIRTFRRIGGRVIPRSVDAAFRILLWAINLHRIEAGCAVDNIASVKVLEKSA